MSCILPINAMVKTMNGNGSNVRVVAFDLKQGDLIDIEHQSIRIVGKVFLAISVT
eukprot:CAMPEP_0196152764 /NCGR_PEP_ID=MMETSP0910-20130528/36039_1 /TAXON_ID=49265 /ORGANISM="Thalassiosira rotula, Strain GSO102" /LENGTH=54 /DNA_ID=CAMNT_0041416431 /DNA_START=88 /DNA_END=249 /DNA_ORIENTATION=-